MEAITQICDGHHIADVFPILLWVLKSPASKSKKTVIPHLISYARNKATTQITDFM